MQPSILALSTAVPPHIYYQDELCEKAIAILGMTGEKAELTKRIYQNSAIYKRHSVLEDFLHPRERWDFWGPQYPKMVPGMSQRNARYKEEAPKLAEQVVKEVLKRWCGKLNQITHLISISCTGMVAPGIEYYLMQNLGLSSGVNRLGINFMGCFGAFKGLSVARAFALENPKNRILIVCTELCTLHLQADLDAETITGHSLFADGAAAAVIGAQPQEDETPLWEIVKTQSIGIDNSVDKMSWEASDRGYLMRLSHTVPVLIGRTIKNFVNSLLTDNLSPEQCDWAIHPGGKSIVQAVERGLNLTSDQTEATWETLKNYGNMSSATFLFVLDYLAGQKKRRPWSAGLGFGPGLSAEGILLKATG